MNRLIREGRFGAPKCFKTGSVVGSYPKPMLVLSLDPGGLDILPPKGYIAPKGMLQLDSCFEDVEWIEIEQLAEKCKLPKDKQPKITAIDFAKLRMELANELYVPRASTNGYSKFVQCLRALQETGCPWETVVVDPVTGLCDMVHQHIASTNAKRMEDAMKWATDIGFQVIKTQGALSTLPAHTVMIMHETTVREMDDKSRKSVVREMRVMIPSNFAREKVATLFPQFFYQQRNGTEIELLTADSGYIKAGLGARWPLGLPEIVGPLYKDIYGR